MRRESPDGKVEIVVQDRPFSFPHDLCLNQSGQLIVSDGYGKCLWRAMEGQAPQKWIASDKFDNPVGMAYHGGKIYLADSRAKQVFVIDADGKVEPLVKQ